jgi:Raf kinase inhibitor-like YbhB/YbcL family protein
MALTLESPSFDPGSFIPTRYAKEGDNVSPPLAWKGEPKETKSFVLLVEDPDAPDPRAPKRIFTHWIVYNMPNLAHELTEDASRLGLPRRAEQGVNDWGDTAYGGPQPPIGVHRYFFKLYALDTELPMHSYHRDELLRAIEGHVLDQAELVGTFDAQPMAQRAVSP